ncbi:MAG: DUF1013 domain-containing protein, partial [Alphaproteobacteria bacterium]|nr:DUF1013 domain-containing protein [Alphaproteobacteria bacterium]
HELEVKNIADAESHKMQGLNPILNGQLTRENIAAAEADPTVRLTLTETIVNAQEKNKRGGGYTPKLHRQNRMGGILWIVKNYPELSDAQIARLMRSTNPTVSSIRNKTHKDYTDIKVSNPITLGLVSEGVLKEEVTKAQKKAQKNK